jgi:DnaJ-domain-containing protein 1
MSFRQIFDRIVRIARAEANADRSSDFERELRRAEELIDESRRPRRSSIEEEDPAPDETKTSTPGRDPEYLRACRTLGVQPGATREQIASTYRARARDFHPDRVSHLPPDAQKEMLRRMQELNLAYEYLERRETR